MLLDQYIFSTLVYTWDLQEKEGYKDTVLCYFYGALKASKADKTRGSGRSDSSARDNLNLIILLYGTNTAEVAYES